MTCDAGALMMDATGNGARTGAGAVMATTRRSQYRTKSRALGLAAAACIAALVSSGLPGLPASAQSSAPAAPTPQPASPDPSLSPTTTVPPWDATPKDPSKAVPAPPPEDPSKPKGFDEKASKVVEAETTPTKLVYDNPDGSRTVKIHVTPQRFKDSAGKWVDYDLDLATRPDGSLGAKAAPQAAILNKRADGNVASVATSAGPVSLRHPSVSPAVAALDKREAKYAGALSGGRDLKIALTLDGFEESVVLPDAKAPASYTNELVLPAGVTVRQADQGVELVDKAGKAIASFGGGFAYDAEFSRGAVPAPVSVRLVSQTANVATLEVAIADQSWLSAPGRAFPVTIDPTFAQLGTAPGSGGIATTVIDGTAANTAYYGSISLGAGRYNSGHTYRTLLRFDLSSLPADAVVTYAQLALFNGYTGFAYSCTGKTVDVRGLAGPFSSATTWNNKPAVVAGAPATSPAFAHQPSPNAAGTYCPPDWAGMPVTSIVQGWRSGVANHGVELRTNEADMGSFQHFWSAHYGTTGAYQPYLQLILDRVPNPPTGVSATPNADGTVTVSWTASTVPADASAVDWYAVLAENPDGSYAGETALVSPGPSPMTAILANLARSKDYRFGVYPHNGAGYNLAVPKVQAVTPPDPLVQAGDAPFFSYDSLALNDRLGAQVNIGTGNLEVSAADIAIPVVGGSRSLGRSYNSLALAPASTYKTSPLFGPAWRFSEAPDRRLLLHSDGSVTYLSGSGRAQVFAAGTLAAPAGTDATLVKNANGTYKLTFHHSALVLDFRTDGLMTSEVDRNGNTIAFNYPAGGGYPASIAGNAGAAPANTVTITYGAPGGKVSSISQTADGTTRTVSYAYDAAGYLYQVTNAGGVTTFEYDPTSRNLIKITGPAPISQVTQFGYDSARRVSSVTRVLPTGNSVTSYNYANPSQPTRTDARNNVTTFTVDGAGRVTKATDAKGKFTTAEYTLDAKVGAVENATHGASGRTVNSWDKNDGDSLSQSQSPTGALVKATFPTSGLKYLPDTVTDSMGSASTISYDGPGNLQSTADALNNTAAIKYNADGTVDFAVDPMNVTSPNINLQDRTKTTQYGYNALHQLTSVTPPSGNSLGVRNLTYDGFGRLKTVTTPANNVTTTYGYDALDRLRSETHSNGAPTISYDYDANGNLFHRIDGSGTTTYIHDAVNRLTSKAIPGGPTLTYGYDAVGNLASLGGDGRGTTTYQYDKVNRLEQMTESGTGRINVFAYNADGQRTDTWYAATYTGGGGVRYDVAGNVVAPNGFAAHIRSELNNGNQLTRIKTTRASSDVDANRVADISYSYDFPTPNPCPNPPAGIVQTGLRQSSTDNITGKLTNYCYDGAGRLIKAMTNNGGPTYEWTYDADGNRLSGPEGAYPAHNTANQMTGPGTIQHDANGNLTTSPGLSFNYNGLDQTTSINASGNTVNMGYAGSGQAERTSVGATTQVNGILGVQSEATAGTATYYERDSQGTLVSERTPGGDFYYVFDGLGSVIGLVDPAGTHRATYTYDPYGAHATATALNGALPPNPWRYAGGYRDPTGLYKFGARYYEPATGRWTQQDSVVTLGNPARGNRYAYAGNNPVNYVDPSGRSFKKRAGEFFGDLADVAGGVAAGAAVACLGGVGCGPAAVAGSISLAAGAFEAGIECSGGDECADAAAGVALSLGGFGAQGLGRKGAAAFADTLGAAFDFSKE